MFSFKSFLIILVTFSVSMLSCSVVVVDGFATTPLGSSSKNRSGLKNSFALNMVDPDIVGASSILLAKFDAKSVGAGLLAKKSGAAKAATMSSDLTAQVLGDSSHLLMDFPEVVFKKQKKMSLKVRYAQVLGRLMILGIGLLPNHGFHAEETAVQLFLLGVSLKPVIRSIQLYKCVASKKCVEECEIEFEELEKSLP